MKSKTLTKDIIKTLLKEEYNNKLNSLFNEISDSSFKGKEKKGSILGKDTKVYHSKTGLAYTIKRVGVENIDLETPEGDIITLNKSNFEEEYDLERNKSK
jgi:hypothetical protein